MPPCIHMLRTGIAIVLAYEDDILHCATHAHQKNMAAGYVWIVPYELHLPTKRDQMDAMHGWLLVSPVFSADGLEGFVQQVIVSPFHFHFRHRFDIFVLVDRFLITARRTST